MATTATRLPGIRFETVLPPAVPALPRMDVAAFAGFAASGPVGVPVAVEDVPRFTEVFGGEVPLAWSAERGERVRAHLAAAVREFFRNGGRRCWVLRLAEGAESARFRVPGLLRGRGGAVSGAASLVAGSPGSWADGVSAGATLLRRSLSPGQTLAMEEGVRLLRPGIADLLRLDFANGIVAFFPPPAVAPAADRTSTERERSRIRRLESSYWFRLVAAEELSAGAASLTLLGIGGETMLPPVSWETAGEVVRIGFADASAEGVRPGSWLRTGIADPASPPGLPTVYLLVDDVLPGGGERTAVIRRAWRVIEGGAAWVEVSHYASPPDEESFAASLVSLELWARRTTEPLLRVADVALAPGHPRWLGHFPTDLALTAPAEQILEAPHGALWSQLARPRFPFAADAGGKDVFLPLGVPALPREEWWQSAEASGRSPLERDGLAAFSAELFLDDDLKRYPAEALLDAAFYREYQQEPPQPPVRLHTLLKVEEASILAVPDAVHPRWELREGSGSPPDDAIPPALAAPAITSVGEPDEKGWIEVRWTALAGATGYRLEHSPDPRFRSEVRVTSTLAGSGEPTSARIRSPSSCPAWLWLRVRAEGERGPGRWSETEVLELPQHRFRECGLEPLPAPGLLPPASTLSPPAEAEGRLVLEWTGSGDRFLLVSAADPSFASSRTEYEGSERGYALWAPTGVTYFRVAARLGETESPWSATVVYEPQPGPRWEMGASAEMDETLLLSIHEAMLRLCAARSDLTAVLSLPSWYREEEALRHAATLTARLGGGNAEPGDAGARTLSFGALYHPWTVVRASGAGSPLRAIPPEGAVCGVMAARSGEQGAWAAPANRIFAGVAVLEPKLDEASQAAFFGRKINALVPSARGFTCCSEETLSDDPELVGIGVRRLLILLRRLALREGHRYAFQPNDAAFRRLMQRQWERLLGDLFARGAFAGALREEGFRVVTGESVNPRQSVEQARFITELRVAPSRPLHFLTVRLVQTGAGLTLAEP
jgi:hypothetical protein